MAQDEGKKKKKKMGWTLVPGSAGTGQFGGGSGLGSTVTAACGVNPTVGNTLVAVVFQENTVSSTAALPFSFSDTVGNSWQSNAITNNFSGQNQLIAIQTSLVTATGANTVQCVFSNSTGRMAMIVAEFAGVLATGGGIPSDGATSYNSSHSTPPIAGLSTGASLTTQPDDLVVSAIGLGSGFAMSVWNPTGLFTEVASIAATGAPLFVGLEMAIVNSGAPGFDVSQHGWLFTTGEPWTTQTLAIQAANPGDPPALGYAPSSW